MMRLLFYYNPCLVNRNRFLSGFYPVLLGKAVKHPRVEGFNCLFYIIFTKPGLLWPPFQSLCVGLIEYLFAFIQKA